MRASLAVVQRRAVQRKHHLQDRGLPEQQHPGIVARASFTSTSTFTQGPTCVICIDDLNAKQLRPHINPNLKYNFIRTQKTGDMVNIGSHGITEFYVCGSAEGDCPRIAQQDPFDGRKAFGDFILFVYEAATVPSASGAGRQTAWLLRLFGADQGRRDMELDALTGHILRGILMVKRDRRRPGPGRQLQRPAA